VTPGVSSALAPPYIGAMDTWTWNDFAILALTTGVVILVII
jgi:hypothetical protein